MRKLLLTAIAAAAFIVPAQADTIRITASGDTRSYAFNLDLPLRETAAPGTGVEGDIGSYDFAATVDVTDGDETSQVFAYVGFTGQLAPGETTGPQFLALLNNEVGPFFERFELAERLVFGGGEFGPISLTRLGDFAATARDGTAFIVNVEAFDDIPEPAALGLLGMGLLGIGLARRRRL